MKEKNMEEKITRVCEICGKEFIITKDKYHRLSRATCCSNKCSHIKTVIKGKKTKLIRYGDENYNNFEKGLLKKQEFSKEKRDEIRKRITQTRYIRYNGQYESEVSKEKRKQTNLKKRGVEYNFQDKNGCMKGAVEKTRQTKLKNHTTHKEILADPLKKAQYLDKCFETKKINGTLSQSTIEKEIRNFIEALGIKTTKIITGKGETRFEIDIYIPDKNIGIEVNGAYFHASNGPNGKKMIKRHYNKMLIAKEKNIDLIQIWEDQWKNKQEIIKDILRARLGVLSSCIYARNCIIKEIPVSEYKIFCEKNHIQGYKAAKIRLGLYHNNELAQIASFNKCQAYGRRKIECEYEWIRGCIASNNKVIGGTSKLLAYFIKTYTPTSILCYADANLFNGIGYEKAGFKFISYTGPDKFYIENNTLRRIMRNPYKYKEYKQAVIDGKLFECYGAGSRKFIWSI